MRVLIVSTPIDARAHLNGSTRAVIDLASALAATGLVQPIVMARDGAQVPKGCESLTIPQGSAAGSISLFREAHRCRPTIIHALFAPRASTAIALRALGRLVSAPIVQTVPSVPRNYRAIHRALASDVIVATSESTLKTLVQHGVSPSRMQRLPLPFSMGSAPPSTALPQAFDRIDDPGASMAPHPYALYVGDYEFGDGFNPTLEAFGALRTRHADPPHLIIAARTKTPASVRIAREIDCKIKTSTVLRGSIRVLGEVASLLPWIASARCVLLPASSTYAKLDHPRVLLEAIALGRRIVVGTAPSLAELVRDGAVGEVVTSQTSLGLAIERALLVKSIPAASIARILDPRRPEIIAAAYVDIYARAVRRRTA
ncbi:MAG: hypothetical protein NVS3B20_05920 [Polyangiales bacterium]